MLRSLGAPLALISYNWSMKLLYGIFYTRDIQRITDFYRDVLKFEFAFGSEKFAAFEIGNALLGIKISEHEREIPGHQTIIVEVDDVEELYQSCKSMGVKIYKELSSEDWGDNFAILDPDDNKVEFTQK